MIKVAGYMTEDTIDIVRELLKTAKRLLAAQAREAERIEGEQAWQEENDALGGESTSTVLSSQRSGNRHSLGPCTLCSGESLHGTTGP